MSLRFETLEKHHVRDHFDCKEEALNMYLRYFAHQDMRRELARTFVLRKAEDLHIIGYYTLCSEAINVQDLPDHLLKKLPQYPVPVSRLARLAVDKGHQKQGYGELLLVDALARTSRAGESMGIYGIIIDAKHEDAKQFYQKYGFEVISHRPLLLFSPLKVLKNKLGINSL